MLYIVLLLISWTPLIIVQYLNLTTKTFIGRDKLALLAFIGIFPYINFFSALVMYLIMMESNNGIIN